MLSFLASSFSHLLESFPLFCQKAHSVGFCVDFSESMPFVFFPISSFQRKRRPCLIILGVQSVSLQHFHLLKVFLWLTIPAATDPVFLLCLSLELPLETFSLLLFLGTNVPTFLVCTGLFAAFSITFQDTPSSPRPPTTATSSKVYLHLPPHRFLL